jgi:hypothetical protein
VAERSDCWTPRPYELVRIRASGALGRLLRAEVNRFGNLRYSVVVYPPLLAPVDDLDHAADVTIGWYRLQELERWLEL